MKLSAFALASLLSMAKSAPGKKNEGLSIDTQLNAHQFAIIGPGAGGYVPTVRVTDHNAIDLDQEEIANLVGALTEAGFSAAKAVYTQGGHSKSYAIVIVDPLENAIAKGTELKGMTESGEVVNGMAYADANVGDISIKFQYKISDIQSQYVNCQVGALPSDDVNVDGCLKNSGIITNRSSGDSIAYNYDKTVDNNNGRTIQGFSTAAEKKILPISEEYAKFVEYYGDFDYGNKWVLAALDGEATSFDNGNADFSTHNSLEERAQAVKKGTVFLNVYMYVVYELEKALLKCHTDCDPCNYEPNGNLDEGVAFYTGSTEEFLLYKLANKRSADFKTGGSRGVSTTGAAKVNYDIFRELSSVLYNINAGACDEADDNVHHIIDWMSIPLIQGALKYGYQVAELGKGAKQAGEASTFAAGVLPRVHACDPVAAAIIHSNLEWGFDSNSIDFPAVKEAFESTYACMGITCDDVGGLLDDDGTYYPGAEKCTSAP